MAAWLKPSYQIRKDFRSTIDPLKHDSHAPFSPLYRPGQEQMMNKKDKDSEQRRYDDKIPSLPINDNLQDSSNGLQAIDDHTPRLTSRIDPRYGSAKGNREMDSSPFGNVLPGRDSRMSRESNNVKNNESNHFGQPFSSRDQQEYFKYLTSKSKGTDFREQSPMTGGAGFGSATDRTGQKQYYDSEGDKPWTNRGYKSADRMVDPRSGSMAYSGIPGVGRLMHGGALLFIRFPTGSGPGKNENIAVASQAFLRSKTHDMGGKFLGLARSVQDYGYPDGGREAVGVYHFPSPQKALLFFQYDNIIRQPDFPPPYGHAEMWIVSNAYLPDNMDSFNTFLLSEVKLHEGRQKRDFFEVFQKPFEEYLASNGVMPFVVCSYGPHDRQSLRRHAYHHQAIVTCHLFQGLDHLRWISDEEKYLKYRNLHNQMAEEKCMVFTLDKYLCP